MARNGDEVPQKKRKMVTGKKKDICEKKFPVLKMICTPQE
jgi:hypothetical protein